MDLRGNIWESPTFPKAAQKKILEAAGCSVIYDDFEAALVSLRTGSRLVVHTARGLGRTPEAMRKNMDRVHAKKAVVMDAETGRLSSNKKHRADMLEEGRKQLGNERRGPRKRSKKDRRMPWDQVAQLYFDPRLSNAELEDAVADGFTRMTYHTMRRHFGKPRGAPVGRPSAGRKRI